MTNYERKKNMTIEEMAEDNVKASYDDYGIWFSITSDSKRFNDRKSAIAHEIDWLNQEAEDE